MRPRPLSRSPPPPRNGAQPAPPPLPARPRAKDGTAQPAPGRTERGGGGGGGRRGGCDLPPGGAAMAACPFRRSIASQVRRSLPQPAPWRGAPWPGRPLRALTETPPLRLLQWVRPVARGARRGLLLPPFLGAERGRAPSFPVGALPASRAGTAAGGGAGGGWRRVLGGRPEGSAVLAVPSRSLRVPCSGSPQAGVQDRPRLGLGAPGESVREPPLGWKPGAGYSSVRPWRGVGRLVAAARVISVRRNGERSR